MRTKLSNVYNKPVLCLDTSLAGCVVGLLKPHDDVFYSDLLKTNRDQAAKLLPIIQGVLANAGVGFKDIGLIVTTIGPGSFTGLRIGMTTANTLGSSLNVPVQGVDTISAMIGSCATAKTTSNYFCVLETKRDDFYCGAMTADFEWIFEPCSLSYDDAIQKVTEGEYVLCGDAVGRFTSAGLDCVTLPVIERELLNPRSLCDLGLRDFIKNGYKAQRPTPLYLRDADVSKSLKIQREINNYSIVE